MPLSCLSCPEPARKSKKLAIAQVVSNKQTQRPLLLTPFSLQILVMEIKRGVPTTRVGSDSRFQSRIFPVGILRLLGPSSCRRHDFLNTGRMFLVFLVTLSLATRALMA